jgi:hypothetical protein
MFALSADAVKKIMKYFEKIDLPVFTEVSKEMYRLLESNIIFWDNGQICLNSTVNQPDNYRFGVGSLRYDWDNKTEKINFAGEIKYDVPLRHGNLVESDFKVLCTQFKNTLFEDIYNLVSNKYKIGRMRLMKLEPKTCLSWHRDADSRLHYPIKTQKGCLMIIEDEVLFLEKNVWYMTNTKLSHTAINASTESRTHLVIDILAA